MSIVDLYKKDALQNSQIPYFIVYHNPVVVEMTSRILQRFSFTRPSRNPLLLAFFNEHQFQFLFCFDFFLKRGTLLSRSQVRSVYR